MFFKRKKVQDWARKIDKIITWLIIWTAVTSMIGLSRTWSGKKITKNITKEWTKVCKKWYSIFWKCIVWTINFFSKK